MRVCDLMDRKVIVCRLDDSIDDVVRIMKANQFCPIAVVDQTGEVWGLVSRLAVIRFYGEDLKRMCAEDVMRPYKFEVNPQWPIERAVGLMKRTGFEHLIVIDPHAGPKRPIGILASFDIVMYMAGIETGHYEHVLKMPSGWCPPGP
ncbi:MAG: CBS domain-containing protein [Syntrophobacteraceae bacterium]